MRASTDSASSFHEKKIQHFQKIVHEMAKALAKAKTPSQQIDWSLYIQKKFPEINDIPPQKAASLCASRHDYLSLHALQKFHAAALIKTLEPFLLSLSQESSNYLTKALHTTVYRYLDGLDYRFPKPAKAPIEWEQALEKIKLLRFENEWKELARHAHKLEPCYLIYQKSTSWKIRALERLALAHTLGHGKSDIKLILSDCYIPHLTVWGRHNLEDEKLGKLIKLISPKESLTLEEISTLGPQLESALIESFLHLKEVSYYRCKRAELKRLLSSPAPFLKRLTLCGAHFEKDDFSNIQMPSLLHLDLSESNFSSDQIICMPCLPQVKSLNLYRCYDIITLSVELLKNKFPYLRELILDNCGSIHNQALSQLPETLSKISLGWISTLTESDFEKLETGRAPLYTFHAKQNSNFGDTSLEIISEHKNLTSLHLDFCSKLSAKALELCLPQLKKLRDLSLKGLTLYSDSWQWIESLPLKRLNAPCWINTPETFTFPNLEHLDLGRSEWLTPEILEYLLEQPSLKELKSFSIENARGLTDRHLPLIADWKELKHLRVWNQIDHIQLFSTDGAKQLKKLEKLEHLELAYCGTFSLSSLETLLNELSCLKTFEFGPLFQISPQDVLKLQKQVPWVKITCYQYPELPSF